MIASWICYSIGAGALIALAVALVERPIASLGIPTRIAPAAGLALCAAVAVGTAIPRAPMHSDERGISAGNVRAPTVPLRMGGSAAPLPDLPGARPLPAPSAEGSAPAGSAASDAVSVGRLSSERIAAVSRLVRSWDRALLVLWLALSTLVALRLAAGFLGLRRIARRAEHMVLDGHAVLVTEDIGPASLVAPRAVLVPRWALRLDPAARMLALQHEREHLAARDPLLLLLANLVIVFLPWQLPAWWLLRQLRHAVEIDCDARVLARSADPRRYAELLLHVARRATLARAVPVAGVVLVPLRPTATSLHRRIDTMTRPTRTTRVRRVLQLSAGMAAAQAVLLLPQPSGLRAATPPAVSAPLQVSALASRSAAERSAETEATAVASAASAIADTTASDGTPAPVPHPRDAQVPVSFAGADDPAAAQGADSVIFGNMLRIPGRMIASRDLFTRGVLRFERDSIKWKGDTAAYPGVVLLRFADDAFDVEFEILPYDPYLEVRTKEQGGATDTPLICSLRAARIRFSRTATGAPLRIRTRGTQWRGCARETERENWRGLVRATSRPAPEGPDADRAIVHVTEVGLLGTADEPAILQVFAAGPARVGIGGAPMQPLTDTLRLDRVPAMTLDVTDADVHVRLLSPGQLRLGGEVTGGAARRVAAQGREIVFRKGGQGIVMTP